MDAVGMSSGTGPDGPEGAVPVPACASCPHDASTIPWLDLPSTLAEAARKWRDFLAAVLDYPGGMDDLCVRPAPGVWSAVEYGCHVRDVLALTARRIEVTMLAAQPRLEPWDPDAAATDGHYLAQDPQAVADDLVVAAHELGGVLQPIAPSARQRTAALGPARPSVDDLARSAVHEALHHLADARTVIPQPC